MFRVRVLGGFALDEFPDAAAPVLLRRRAEAVLAVLAVCGDLGCYPGPTPCAALAGER